MSSDDAQKPRQEAHAMARFLSRVFPSATNMIRLDHTHVLSTYHQYKPGAPMRVKRGLVNTICAALEVHAQLEEEIFYPAVRAVTQDELIAKSFDEHREMRQLIAQLRQMQPEDEAYDQTLAELMRDVMHHVADEETLVIPEAERLLADQLGDLGMRMTRRRLELVVPRTGEIALNMGRAASGNTAALAVVGLVAVGMLAARRGGRRRMAARAAR